MLVNNLTKYFAQQDDSDSLKKRICYLAKQLNTYPFLIASLSSKGFTDNEIMLLYNHPLKLINHAPLPDAEKASDLLINDFKEGRNIYIYADYDVDGLTSGAIMGHVLISIKLALKSKSKVHLHYPQRSEGYGLNMKWCSELPDKSCVITVDNGITKREETIFLKTHFTHVIITDHHEVVNGQLPDTADAIINPSYNEADRKYYAGVAVAYNFITTLFNKLKSENYKLPNPLIYLSLVAMGTISDVMPFTSENAAIIKIGIALINKGKSFSFINEYKNYTSDIDINATDIAFGIVPELNAASRMGHIELGAQCLLSSASDNKELIQKLKLNNEARKKITQKATEYVMSSNYGSKYIRLVDASEFKAGIHGILAAKLSEAYDGVPAIVYHKDKFTKLIKGSVRFAMGGCNIKKLFDEEIKKGNLKSCGGHGTACVITADENMLDSFIESFSKVFEQLKITAKELITNYDASLGLTEMSTKLLNEVSRIPFTPSEAPVFLLRNLTVLKAKSSKSNPNHLCLTVTDNTSKKDIWAWGFMPKYEQLGKPTTITLVCKIAQDFRIKNRIAAIPQIIDMMA